MHIKGTDTSCDLLPWRLIEVASPTIGLDPFGNGPFILVPILLLHHGGQRIYSFHESIQVDSIISVLFSTTVLDADVE